MYTRVHINAIFTTSVRAINDEPRSFLHKASMLLFKLFCYRARQNRIEEETLLGKLSVRCINQNYRS